MSRRITAVVTETEVSAAVPVAVVSEANIREHWGARHRRHHMQESMVRMWLARALHHPPFGPPYLVTFTRRGVRALDTDNLCGAFKACRDEVARLLKINDGDEGAATWHYDQVTGCKGDEIGIHVKIEPRPKANVRRTG